MKKIYLFSIALLALFATTQAQNVCPSGVQGVRNYMYVDVSGNTYCVVVISNFWSNAEFTLLTAGNTIIPASNGAAYIHTDASGNASFTYNCQLYTPDHVQVCLNGTGCCTKPVPAAASLPIKLTSFNGRLKTDNTVTLDWTSAVEFDSYQYQIERSYDGKNYESVGTLKAAGASTELTNYTFTDQLPSAGSFFYRLKQVDIDGRFEYSKVVYVNSKKGAGVITKVFPNPFTTEIQLIGATAADMTQGNIHVFSISGQAVGFHISGANAIAIDQALPSGMYIVQVKDQRFKLVKK